MIKFSQGLYHIHICFVELQPVIKDEPSDPFNILEGDNITLEWSYDLGGGSFRRIEFRLINSPTPILEVETVGQTPDYLDNDYIGRLQVNVTTTQTSITILKANRTVDSKDYGFNIFQRNSPTVTSTVQISVQCKYNYAQFSFFSITSCEKSFQEYSWDIFPFT